VAKRKKAQPWGAVFGRIRCVWQPDKLYPPKTTAAELDALESELNFRFPLSYRAFAEQFGLGGNLQVFPYCICVAMLPVAPWPEYWYSYPAGESVTGRTNHDRSRPDLRLDRRARPHPTPYAGRQHYMTQSARPTTALSHLVAFAGEYDEGEGTYLFQPPEVTDAAGRECRIFALNSAGLVRPVVNSFWEWLEWVERSYEFQDNTEELIAGGWDPANEPHRVSKPDRAGAVMQYEPRWLREKKSPVKKHVQLWLTWNNNTARDLALSIRDHGRTDAFPILADALQEAGCTNVDLLDSCRTGDPDIDGAWVLQVLLGKS
jgi:hypothetical protein